jgi:hypothetical protein
MSARVRGVWLVGLFTAGREKMSMRRFGLHMYWGCGYMDTIRRRYAAVGSRTVLTLQAPRSLSISHFLVKKKNKFCPRLGAPVRHTTVPVPERYAGMLRMLGSRTMEDGPCCWRIQACLL